MYYIDPYWRNQRLVRLGQRWYIDWCYSDIHRFLQSQKVTAWFKFVHTCTIILTTNTQQTMLPTMSICQTPQVGYRAPHHIPLSKISYVDQHPAQRGRAPANPPSRRSLSTNIAEGNSSATAKAGINGVVPRPSDEHSVIQKLKEALRMQPDQTTVLVSPVDLAFSWHLNAWTDIGWCWLG